MQVDCMPGEQHVLSVLKASNVFGYIRGIEYIAHAFLFIFILKNLLVPEIKLETLYLQGRWWHHRTIPGPMHAFIYQL